MAITGVWEERAAPPTMGYKNRPSVFPTKILYAQALLIPRLRPACPAQPSSSNLITPVIS